jgi:hypothetical protein
MVNPICGYIKWGVTHIIPVIIVACIFVPKIADLARVPTIIAIIG